jgi:hypothetical protein
MMSNGAGALGAGWHSFDHGGAHFIGLVNVVNLKAGGRKSSPWPVGPVQ